MPQLKKEHFHLLNFFDKIRLVPSNSFSGRLVKLSEVIDTLDFTNDEIEYYYNPHNLTTLSYNKYITKKIFITKKCLLI